MNDGGGVVPSLLGLGALFIFWRLVSPAINRRRWRVAADFSTPGIMLALLSIITFWALLSNLPIIVLPALVIAIAFHEYGHVLAYRLAGHRDPVFRLIPFGGVAMSDEPVTSQVENAFISLMGPGFSIALSLILLIAASWIPDPTWRFNAVIAAGGVAALNLLNMAPFYPLDGGRALKAVLTIFGNGVATAVTIGLSVMLGALGVYLLTLGRGGEFFVLISVFGGVAAVAEARVDGTVRRMSVLEALQTILAFAAIIAALWFAATPMLRALTISTGSDTRTAHLSAPSEILPVR